MSAKTKKAAKSGRRADVKGSSAPSRRKAARSRGQDRPGPNVGLDASNDGLDALERFFRTIPADSGLAFIVVAHLDPALKSAMTKLLGRATRMPVIPVTAPVDTQPEHVYVTVRKIGERKLAAERQLLAELNHRVKNMLATVLSIANQTIDDAESLDSFRGSFTGRIRALSEAQNLLTRTNWSGVTMRDVLRIEAAPHIRPRTANFTLEGPELLLTPRAALTLALVAHELTTNAVKYGALSVPAGSVLARWSVTGPRDRRRVIMEWRESGGPKVRAPKRRGFGRKLIEEGLSYELGGNAELRFDPGGFTCRIELPTTDTLIDEHRGPSS